tara:strand:+ start:256 stop:423 length:168 start_codon:yes stop_codon:yes gene_type:complete
MKSFARPLIEGKWKVYVTDDDYDTYTTVLDKEEPPSDTEMKELFKENKRDFREVY